MAETVTLYKYVNTKYLASILKNQELYMDDGSNFNDPFELLMIDKNTNEVEQIKGLHILSLTNSYIKKLMWSHYTDNHKGVCLTVQVPKKLVYPVCYTSKRVYKDTNIYEKILKQRKGSINQYVKSDYSDLGEDKLIAYVKDSKWTYEKEYRIVLNDDDSEYYRYDKTEGKYYFKVKIKNVYMGVRFDENNNISEEELERICSEKDIKISKIIFSMDTYALKIKK